MECYHREYVLGGEANDNNDNKNIYGNTIHRFVFPPFNGNSWTDHNEFYQVNWRHDCRLFSCGVCFIHPLSLFLLIIPARWVKNSFFWPTSLLLCFTKEYFVNRSQETGKDIEFSHFIKREVSYEKCTYC
jgi:hypothetical protein